MDLAVWQTAVIAAVTFSEWTEENSQEPPYYRQLVRADAWINDWNVPKLFVVHLSSEDLDICWMKNEKLCQGQAGGSALPGPSKSSGHDSVTVLNLARLLAETKRLPKAFAVVRVEEEVFPRYGSEDFPYI